jgi:hypothetical protein
MLYLTKEDYMEVVASYHETELLEKIQFLKSFNIFQQIESRINNYEMLFYKRFYKRNEIIFKEGD